MITIGADPELFLKSHNDSPVSSIGKIGGTKEKPIPVGNGIFLQEDNVTVEYNIPPCETSDQFIAYNTQALEIIKDKAKTLNLDIKITASQKMPREELADPRAWVFGCEPDFNAWKLEYNKSPKATTYRAAGGHVHIGFEGSNPQKVDLTRLLDNTLGTLFTLLDEDQFRRKMYGKAGAMRFKPYGIEYRTLSNFWLTHPKLMQIVFDVSKNCALHIKKNDFNTHKTPKSIVTHINKRMPELLYRHVEQMAYSTLVNKTYSKLQQMLPKIVNLQTGAVNKEALATALNTL